MNKISSPVKVLMLMALLFMGATMARADICVLKVYNKFSPEVTHLCINNYQYLSRYNGGITQMFEKANGYSRADSDTSVPIPCWCK